MVSLDTAAAGALVPLQFVPKGSRTVVFQRIYWVFLLLGTVVGIVVITYMLYKAYKYRAAAWEGEDDSDRPELGEIPTGGGGGRKLFLSFTLSAIIVISLITWTYFTLLYVENPDPVAEGGEEMTVEVVGHQFYWQFVYPNGASVDDTLRVPADRRIRLRVTSADVFHNFGAPGLRTKADAIPGQTTTTWFIAEETGDYQANCYELCGTGHSYMAATVRVMEPDAFEEWYAGTNGTENASARVDPVRVDAGGD